MKAKDQKNDLATIQALKGLGSPNSKTDYLRLGLQLDEEQSQPFYRGKSIAIAKLAAAKLSLKVFELQRAKFEKECGRIIPFNDVENAEYSEIIEKQMKAIESGKKSKQL